MDSWPWSPDDTEPSRVSRSQRAASSWGPWAFSVAAISEKSGALVM